MFELSVASKYLIPRRRQLSVSIISLISILVISLVVWLIVVFFSVTNGLEKSWVLKLTALTAPVRITPTNAYYNSYYYQVDSISEDSGYSYKTIREKRHAGQSDPYNPEYDQEVPAIWPAPDLDENGNLKDIVQLAFFSVENLKQFNDIKAQDFELTASHINLNLQRESPILNPHHFRGHTVYSNLSYPSYLGNFVNDNPNLARTLLPIERADINNYLYLTGTAKDLSHGEANTDMVVFPIDEMRARLIDFFQTVQVTALQPKSYGWTLPSNFIPETFNWHALAIIKDGSIKRFIIPVEKSQIDPLRKLLEEQNLKAIKGILTKQSSEVVWMPDNEESSQILTDIPLSILDQVNFQATLIDQSLPTVRRLEDIQFAIKVPVQKTVLQGIVAYKGLEIASYRINPNKIPPWIYSSGAEYFLPSNTLLGEGILLPKSFREAGVFIGDQGTLSYLAPTVSILQEQYVPVYVAGFYDPGIIPIGGKFILANPDVTSLIRASHQQDDKSAITNGINVKFADLSQADQIKQQLLEAFQAKGISRYWSVQTYREYEFTKEIMQELKSQKYLFMLIAIVIILVACSNIISMLVILVNDKKVEIGILRAMGASSKSIALIFGTAGAAIGIFGSMLGISLAIFTLNHLDLLVKLLSSMQGHEMFSATLYGNTLPSELSFEALFFVLMATLLISLLAGIVPAVKACMIRPSTALRSAGG
jgi:lipoprotein-releasing system permease protein